MRVGHSSRNGAGPATRPIRGRLWFWPGVVTLGYLLLTLSVLGLSYRSEMAKIDRGTFSDTVSPYLGLNVLTYPVSSFHGIFAPYPVAFDAAQFRDQVSSSVAPGLVNIFAQTVLVALLALLVTMSIRPPATARRATY